MSVNYCTPSFILDGWCSPTPNLFHSFASILTSAFNSDMGLYELHVLGSLAGLYDHYLLVIKGGGNSSRM